MSIAPELLVCARRIADVAAPPRVRALHRPAHGADGKRSAFCAIELDGGWFGLAYVSLGDTRSRIDAIAADALAGRDVLDLVGGCASGDVAARTLGIAALNALSAWFFDRAGFVLPDAQGVLPGIAPAPDEHVGMVGLFEPLVEPVLACGAQLTVIELDPALTGEREGWRVTLEADVLGECDAVICTSTTLLNHTLESVLARCTGAREFALLGPGAGCVPDALFANGVTRIAGSRVTDGPALVDALSSGQSWGRHARKFDLARADYPGLDALLERL
ncbi:MAG: hypothetical protein H2060_04685 [Azoarcus sp.]|nr:hypothetical protein [Azoarcus sp.]